MAIKTLKFSPEDYQLLSDALTIMTSRAGEPLNYKRLEGAFEHMLEDFDLAGGCRVCASNCQQFCYSGCLGDCVGSCNDTCKSSIRHSLPGDP
ncbi:hypothetical protein GGD81_001777 [Rhodobium orientis]|uniref:Uncharacterized protein n=1 Tax=Rhodobium orientis TaxID=34017 RepID=A0A327JUM6_9HYPH|nr:hypothetical protein [Rhodobium orientis]MBB4302741.1 hypothetical protein [Rhodobium orientis]MBK5948522.1 hypothetical protein [Rhodobium orientis]RAI29791.1 hypothetical protein CH339_01880 [Rhodobium orientis]